MYKRQSEQLCRCCYCDCYAAIASPTSSFAIIATTNALSILRVAGDTATLKLLLLTSFAAVATASAYADASVARVALLRVFKVIAAATATAMMPIASMNASWLVRMPEQTATLPLLLLTSIAAVATAIANTDASVARVAFCLLYTSPSPRD